MAVIVSFFCIAGVIYIIFGFSQIWEKRLIENIPSSTIRGLAMGLVEINGKAKYVSSLISPLFGASCVFYRYSIDRYTRRGEESSWETIVEGDSSDFPFYLDDGTGKVLVSPKSAEISLDPDYKFKTGGQKPLPDVLIRFLEKNNAALLKECRPVDAMLGKFAPDLLTRFVQKDSVSYTGQVRFTECVIAPDETIYVLGTAKKSSNFLNDRKERLTSRLRELKQDSARMAGVDLDKDGKVSIEEWDLVKNKIEQELLEEELKTGPQEELSDVVIGKGEIEKKFIITDKSEKGMVKALSSGAANICFGCALVFWGILYVFYGESVIVLFYPMVLGILVPVVYYAVKKIIGKGG